MGKRVIRKKELLFLKKRGYVCFTIKELDKLRRDLITQGKLSAYKRILNWHKQMLINWGPNRALKLSIKRLEKEMKEEGK